MKNMILKSLLFVAITCCYNIQGEALAQEKRQEVDPLALINKVMDQGEEVKNSKEAVVPIAPPKPAVIVKATNPAQVSKDVSGLVDAQDKEEEVEKLWKHGSLMFDKKTADWINTAVKSHIKQIPLEILIPTLFPPEGKPQTDIKPVEAPKMEVAKVDKPSEAPAYYLKTILYFSKNDWTIWLNNQKITDKSTIDDDVSIVNVLHDEVILLWRNSRIDDIYPEWRDNFISIDGEKYMSPERNIVVDSKTGSISFVLKPNQSLITKPLEVVEGAASSMSLIEKPVAVSPGTSANGNSADAALDAANKKTNKDINNALDNLQNIKMLKTILDQNMEKLR